MSPPWDESHHPNRRAADHSGVIGAHGEAIGTLKEDMRELRQDVGEIKELLANARGGYKVLSVVAAAGGAIGAGLFKLATMKIGG